jgi:hypothetical protein
VWGLWTFGNFCGSGGVGSPTNTIDTGCAQHDRCYDEAGVSFGNNYVNQGSAVQARNQELCDSMIGIRGSRESSHGGTYEAPTIFMFSHLLRTDYAAARDS